MKEIKEAGKKNISRRKLIQAAAGAAVVASVGPLALTTPIAGIGMAQSTNKDVQAIYSLLALWLAMTTNQDFLASSEADIIAATGANATVVGKFKTYVTDASTPSTKKFYEGLRTEFQHVRTTLLAYGGPQCPANLGTLQPISKCALPPQ